MQFKIGASPHSEVYPHIRPSQEQFKTKREGKSHEGRDNSELFHVIIHNPGIWNQYTLQ
jgi:hypothetical protein